MQLSRTLYQQKTNKMYFLQSAFWYMLHSFNWNLLLSFHLLAVLLVFKSLCFYEIYCMAY